MIVSVPLIIAAYLIFVLSAAYGLKKYQGAILWTGALILFCGIMMLLGLGLYQPEGIAGILGVIFTFACAGVLACLALPSNKKETKAEETYEKENDQAESIPADAAPQTDELAMKGEQEDLLLKGTLNTELARKVFVKAIEAGLIQEDGEHYKWTDHKVLLSYMCGRIYCGDYPDDDEFNEKMIWRYGYDGFFPDSELNELFNQTNLAQSRQNRKDSQVPIGSQKIDDLFE